MVVVLWLLYVAFLAPIGLLALVWHGFRNSLRRSDLFLPVVPYLGWVALGFTNLRPKGLTDCEVEIAFLGLVTGTAVLARRLLPKRKLATHPLVLSVVAAVLVWAFKPPILHSDLVGAYLYAVRHPDAPSRIRAAILRGVVLEGMTAEQASVAGGSHFWNTRNGTLTKLTFNNTSQFRTARPVGFTAHIVNGRVTEIERVIDPNTCRDFMRNPKPESMEYPYTGFWRKRCSDNFGLRFERGGSGLYGIHFCGPGGCGVIDTCTRIPDGRQYQVIDADTLLVYGTDRYKRCELQTAPPPN